MKFLCSAHSQHEAEAIASQLESKGIPIVRTNVRSYGMAKGAKMKIDLWVGLESQLQDAVALLNNPSHQVANPANVAEFRKHLEEFQSRPPLPLGASSKLLTLLFGSVLVAFIAWVLWAIVST